MAMRVLIFLLIALLAIPFGEVMPSTEASRQSQAEAAPSAEAKKKKKNTKSKPKFRTVRQSFSNTDLITIPIAGAVNGEGPADPFPSTIRVGGLRNGKILDVNLTLKNLNHSSPQSLDFMLAATQLPGRTAVVMNNVGTSAPPNTTLTLDDQAAAPLPDGDAFFSGTFQPTSDGDVNVFPPPAPAASGNALLGVFNGGNPNGTWQLFVVDETDGTTGNLAGGVDAADNREGRHTGAGERRKEKGQEGRQGQRQQGEAEAGHLSHRVT